MNTRIDREKLPDVVACTKVIGTLRSDVANAWDFPQL